MHRHLRQGRARSSWSSAIPGTGFDAATVPNPLAGENVLKSSGRGIFLINQLMDEVAFKDGGREVQMRKRTVGHAALLLQSIRLQSDHKEPR